MILRIESFMIMSGQRICWQYSICRKKKAVCRSRTPKINSKPLSGFRRTQRPTTLHLKVFPEFTRWYVRECYVLKLIQQWGVCVWFVHICAHNMNCMYTTKAYLWDSARGRGTCCTRALGKRGSNLTAGVGKEGEEWVWGRRGSKGS